MRTTIRLNTALGRQIKELADARGTTFTSLIEEACSLLLREDRVGRSAAGRALKPLPTRNLGGAVDGVDLNKTSKILADLDAERYGPV